jgi:hypothetical protein
VIHDRILRLTCPHFQLELRVSGDAEEEAESTIFFV